MKLIFLFFFNLLLLGCAETSHIVIREGLIIHKHRFYDSIGNEHVPQYEEKDLKIWFKDSAVIYEINDLQIYSNDGEKDKWSYMFNKYVYLDLKTRIHYDYKNFSDTAIPIRKYKFNGSNFIGWNFYGYPSGFSFSDKLSPISDTLVKNVLYSRLKIDIAEKDKNGIQNVTKLTYYLRCDKKNTLFHVDRALDEISKKCPATRLDVSFPDRHQYIISSFYDYASETLTDNEENIFKKWKENVVKIKLPIEINVP